MRHGLTEDELWALSTYNAERHRGIVHTLEHEARMRDLQDRFDEAQRAEWIAQGAVELEGGGYVLVTTTPGPALARRRRWRRR